MPGTDWAAQAADTIDKVVLGVRGRTTAPLERVARVVVYGLFAAIVGTTALVLLLALVVRVVDVVVPGEVWSAYLVLGGIFTLLGLLLWRKRSATTTRS